MKIPRRTVALFIGLASGLVLAKMGFAQQHIMQNMTEAKWDNAPPFLPPGAKIDVLAGNPMGDSLYSLRLKFPAHYRIPAHSHPADENVTVLSGRLFMGMGDKLDPKGGKPLGVGGFVMMPAKANHYAYTNGETIILLHGKGPVEFNYVNPADDPRNKK